jgi:mRNA-degrading endonuclease RelE of RelBE toxin-antitoxin system
MRRKPKTDVPPRACDQAQNSVAGPEPTSERDKFRLPAQAERAKAPRQRLDRRVNERRYWCMATVDVTREAHAEYEALPRGIRPRVTRLFDRLERWPDVSGAKSLSANLAGRYRLRTGDYRVQFRVERDETADGGWRVTVEKVGHRDGFYDE